LKGLTNVKEDMKVNKRDNDQKKQTVVWMIETL
jgi:hypothetical protein